MYSDTICIKYTRKWRWMQVPAKNKAKWERKNVFSQKCKFVNDVLQIREGL